MIIRGIGIPLDKINRAEHKWGIKNNTADINRLLKTAPGTKLHICKECFENVSDAHACDLDPRSAVGVIKSAKYDPRANSLKCVVDVTDNYIKSGINSGTIKKTWSPAVVGGTQDDDGWVHGADFDGLTLVNNPAFDECTFDVSYVAEEGDGVEVSSDPQDPEPTKQNPLDVNKPIEVKIDEEMIKRLVNERVEEIKKSLMENKIEEEKKEEEIQNTKPENQYMTPEQVQAMIDAKEAEVKKSYALNELRLITGQLGVKDIDMDAMKLLPIDQIEKLTASYRGIKNKLPVEEKKSNKPEYYNEQTGTGGMDGSGQFTVGYPTEDGTWSTNY